MLSGGCLGRLVWPAYGRRSDVEVTVAERVIFIFRERSRFNVTSLISFILSLKYFYYNWMWARVLRIYHIFKFCSQKPFTILLFETLACWLISKERYRDLGNGFSYWAFEHDYCSLTFANLHLNYVIANTLFNWRGEGDWILFIC